MKITEESVLHWYEILNAALDNSSRLFINRVEVVETASSTQDECKARHQNLPGLCVTALKQTAGRGRLGRRWYDDGCNSVAMSFVVKTLSLERLSIATGLATCMALEKLGAQNLGIRWPNDIMVMQPDDKQGKLAGVLIEIESGMAFVGIGINVGQTEWPEEIKHAAVSLAQIGVNVARVEVISHLHETLNDVLTWPSGKLVKEFSIRDALCGTIQSFVSRGQTITGIVREINPLHGLVIETTNNTIEQLTAQTTSLIHNGR